MTETSMAYTYDEALSKSIEYFKGDDLAGRVFVDKYALRNSNGEIVEDTPTAMHRRLAKEFARVEAGKFVTPLTEDQIFNLFDRFCYIVPQGSVLYGCGNNEQIVSLSNCFVLSSPVDSYGGILQTDQQLVQISKRRGGVGIDLSHLRPKGSNTKNSSRSSTGIIAWMRRYSNSIREVGQDGRRGALMLTLSVHHPDILDFVTIKNNPSEVTGANISVRYSNEFLQAVEDDTGYELRFPVESTNVVRKIKAREVWRKIIHSAWLRAEPGGLFWDLIKSYNAIDCYKEDGFETESTNPCCLAKSKDVFVMTNNGIKEIKNVNSSDLVWLDYDKRWSKTSGYFDAGIAPVYKVTFSNSEVLYITENHKLAKSRYKREGTKLIYEGFDAVELKNLKVGDKISIHSNIVDNYNWSNKGTYEEGIITGWLTGDGCLSFHDENAIYPDTILDFWQNDHDVADKLLDIFIKENYNVVIGTQGKNNVKRIRSYVYTKNFINKYEYNIWNFKSETKRLDFLDIASKEFIVGFLSSYFSADGCITCNEEAASYSITLASINKSRLDQIKNILLVFGIVSFVRLMREAGESYFENGGGKFKTKDCYSLVITGLDNIKRFANEILLVSDLKQAKLDQLVGLESNKSNKNKNNRTIKYIEYIGEEEVGCIDVFDSHYFTANGIISFNSELPLCRDDSCRLIIQNLFSYVVFPFTAEAYFDYDLFWDHAMIAQRLMDDLIDLEIEKIDQIIHKIKNDPEDQKIKQVELDMWVAIRTKCVNGRRTGLGITGEADMLAALGVKYGSDASINVVGEVHKTQKLASYRASVEMARELGPFPIWDREKERNSPFLLQIKKECLKLYEDILHYGRRNIGNLTIAPTGSMSILTQTTSGIEPLFTLDPYKRRKKINPSDKNARIDFTDQSGDSWQEFLIYHPKVKMWMEITGKTDIKESPWYGCCAEDLDWKQRVRLQAIAQKHIDHAISSTLNLPEDVSEEKVDEIYRTAWKSGCKGITVYRNNCRTGVLVQDAKSTITKTNAPPRPTDLSAKTFFPSIKGQRYCVAVGLFGEEPYELFASKVDNNHKTIDNCTIRRVKAKHYQLVHDGEVFLDNLSEKCDDEEEAFCRLVSTSLRHGANITFIVNQLNKTKGDLYSLSHVIARVLKKFIPDGTSVKEKCPSCNNESLRYSEGCISCACGYSKCS